MIYLNWNIWYAYSMSKKFIIFINFFILLIFQNKKFWLNIKIVIKKRIKNIYKIYCKIILIYIYHIDALSTRWLIKYFKLFLIQSVINWVSFLNSKLFLKICWSLKNLIL